MQSVTVENKVVLITGAFGLLGKTIAKGMLEQGAKVVLADINNKLSAEVNRELAGFDSSNYLIIELDITNENSCRNTIDAAVNKFGKLDVLINNAAIDAKFDDKHIDSSNRTRFELYPMELFKRSVEVNINGTVLMTQVACMQMLKQGFGNIINVASTYSLVAPNQSLYDFGDGNIKFN
ncbi:MAG: SDR family NAD(P)-dependent oxidoreductase, partial [Chitinophagales bacterium]